MKTIIFSLFISILLESQVTTLPLTLLILLFAAVVIRKNEIFLLAFFSGLFLDIFSFKNIGFSSLYFVTFVFVVLLYQKKFEIGTLYFTAIFSFLGSLGYLIIEGVDYALFQALISAFIASVSFLIFTKSKKKVFKYV